MYLRRVRVAGRTFAAALAHVQTVFTPPAPAAQNLGVGLWRPCRGQTCGGVFGVIARIAPARPATPNSYFSSLYAISKKYFPEDAKKTPPRI
jgi:hypothetical protein